MHSYMCPMGLVFGVPGAGGAARRGSHGSLTTAAADVEGDDDEEGGEGEAEGRTTHAVGRGGGESGGGVGGGGERAAVNDGEGPNAPPMLTSTVVAPDASHLRDARRAAGRLERLARVVQTEWVSGAT